MQKLVWFLDLSALLVVGGPLSEEPSSAWIVALNNAEPKLLRAGIENASLSPDGSRVVLTSADSKEIWLAYVTANQPMRKLVVAGENEIFPVVLWSANGSHLICQRRKQLMRLPNQPQSSQLEPQFQRTYESIEVATGNVSPMAASCFCGRASAGIQ
jgi:hypothetical protein